jgi:GlpG protein
MTNGGSNHLLFMNYRSSLASPLTYLRFFTHAAGHGNFAHFIGNMMYILLLGPLLEEKYGSTAVLQIIIITAFITGLINFIFFPNISLLGASGVVFAFILLSSITSAKEREIPLTFILVAVIFIGQQIYEGLFVESYISNLTHILGGIVGAILGFLHIMRRQ